MPAKRYVAALCAAALIVLHGAGLGCAQPQARYEASFIDVFDTITQVALYAPDKAAAQAQFDAVHAELQVCHQLFDIYHEYDGISNLKTVNDAAGKAAVAVDARILGLLQAAVRMHTLTGGRMNIALGSVLSIWHEYRARGLDDPVHAALPDRDALRKADAHTRIEDVILDESAGTVYLADPEMRLDVGAIAKGYAAERAIVSAEAAGARSMLISIGGNVRALGGRADGRAWQVAVQAPGGGAPVCTLNVEGMSLVTSGVYQRYYTVDGKTYHHIIDPETRMPAAYFTSVSVLCPDSAMADALSTALFCMPLEKGLQLVASIADAEALWVAPDGTQTASGGFRRYVAG